jgi:hypothetical protein
MCEVCGWQAALENIESALEDIDGIPEEGEEFGALVRENLESIRAWVEEQNHVTPAQVVAIGNMSQGIGRWLERA